MVLEGESDEPCNGLLERRRAYMQYCFGFIQTRLDLVLSSFVQLLKALEWIQARRRHE